jgi:hypothetical protein
MFVKPLAVLGRAGFGGRDRLDRRGDEPYAACADVSASELKKLHGVDPKTIFPPRSIPTPRFFGGRVPAHQVRQNWAFLPLLEIGATVST